MNRERMSPDPGALAATKFMAPHVPAGMVQRDRLTERLHLGAHAPLTLLAASAGSGKSALLSAWAAEREPGTTAWFSLDPADSDRRRFWRGALEALRRAGVGDPIASLEVHPGLDPDLVLPALVNALEQRPEPIVLVLDDLHEIGDAPAIADLDQLLRRPPDGLRLVVATRADPALRVGRLRVAGALAEIRAADLAFTLEATIELLEVSGIDVTDDVAEQLWERTEGWAAGLRLAALRMRTALEPARFVSEFAGDDTTVADYLLAEVLVQQPPDLREFLLRISVVDAVNDELADALTDRTDSHRVLMRLERDHALLSSSGGARAWHRLHPLLRELLRSELRFTAPEQIPVLHARAAAWFERHNRPSEALRHAAAAEDWTYVSALAARHWVHLLLEGELGALRPVLESLPGDLPAHDPELALALAGVRLIAGDAPGAQRWFEIARDGRTAVAPERRHEFNLGLAAVGLMRGRVRGDIAAAMHHAQAMFERDGTDAAAMIGSDERRALALGELGIAELWTGELTRARRDLEAARGAAAAAGRDWLVVVCLAYLGIEAVIRGRFERATRLCTDAEELAHRRGWGATWPIGITAGAFSTIALHRNRLDEADAQHARAVDRLERSGDRPLRAVTAIRGARILIERGQPDRAFDMLQEARELLRDWPVMPAMHGLLSGIEALAVAAMGDRGAAETLLARDDSGSAEAAVALAQLRLRGDEPAAALEALRPFLDDDGEGDGLQNTRAEMWVVAALAWDMLADVRAAGDGLEHALAAAEVGGLQRAFLMHGDAIAPLLRRHRRNGTSHRALLDDLLAGVEGRAEALPVTDLPESLSEREAAVLRFLPTMMSNQEIASELFVSVNTVKTHLKAIYRKLDVDERRAAIRRARELTLLGPR
jgi:LuxR family maltose regulon positive regulatory protein